jgi:hypothetical protein
LTGPYTFTENEIIQEREEQEDEEQQEEVQQEKSQETERMTRDNEVQ